MIDIHTIGAGGGSIAHVDAGGAFRVGPRSAGATPGPAAYGLGGAEPTVTDANVVLGRIDPARFLGGEMPLDRAAAHEAVRELGERLGLDPLQAAEGIVTIANANMSAAIRSRTIQKGHDPREFTLVAFGGAGPLHAAEVADSLGVPEVLVPPYPGITSATGLLTSDLRYDQMRTVFMVEGAVDAARIDRELAELADGLRARLDEDGVPAGEVSVAAALDCRYVGQGYELRVPLDRMASATERRSSASTRLHRAASTGTRFADPVEIVNLRVTAAAAAALDGAGRLGTTRRASSARARASSGSDGRLQALPTPLPDRAAPSAASPSRGPAVVFQRDTTTVVPPGVGPAPRLREPVASADGWRPERPRRDRTRRRPDHRGGDRAARSTRSRSRWATSWPACPTRRSSASPRTSAA